jgi:archaellum biogenesis protein FlaJ (TadC family)
METSHTVYKKEVPSSWGWASYNSYLGSVSFSVCSPSVHPLFYPYSDTQIIVYHLLPLFFLLPNYFITDGSPSSYLCSPFITVAIPLFPNW